MRIRDQIKRSGYFWLPQNPDKKIPGILSISDGGNIELEVVGLFQETIAAFNGDDDIQTIIGHVEKDGLVTLQDCFYKKKNIAFGGISKSLVYVNKAISGVAYVEDDVIKFNTVSFSVEGISEWVAITGINVNYGNDYKTATINYTPQKELVYNLIDGFRLHIFFGYTLPNFSSTTEARISHQAYFKLSSEMARDFPKFSIIIHRITQFLCFAIGSTVSISDVSATSNDITINISKGKTRPANIKLYYPSLPFSEDEPVIDMNKFLFRFSDIRENAERVFNKWLVAYSIIRPSLGLYFSAVSGDHKYLDGRFLSLAQGLETYHRRTSTETLRDEAEFRSIVASLLWNCPKASRKWLRGHLYHGNDINLGQRIKRIIDPYKSYLGSSKQRNKFIRGVVNTRNYLTHYSEELENESLKGPELWVLCQKMEAVFQLHLLQQLGFEKSDIERILSNNHRLKQKFNEV
ncbi:HEPN domain-containing protein [Salinicola halophilus]|uniref:ApeA N-terminal domain 1-containing protein n=1 Tax=Salinicola halophilus TaxID=184065 RepID=UPI0013A62AD7|nr:HEPN domain-containing protein [Salinicola halophilus]